MTQEGMKSVITQYNLGIKLNNQDKIIHDADDKQNIWMVLRLLNDDYVCSTVTKTKYEARNKLKIK
jgi:hypothetical protein